MKKIFMFAAFMLAVSTALNAQVFVEGSLGFSNGNGKTAHGSTENKDKTTTSFSVEPTVGFELNEKWAAGISLAMEANNTDYNLSTVSKTNATSWAVSPFARYYFLTFKKLGVYAQGNLFLGGESESKTLGSTTIDEPYVSTVGLRVFPAMEYALTERIGLKANLNFMGLNFTHKASTEKGTGSEEETVTTANNFGFGVNTDNVLSTNAFTIGFTYKF